VPDEDGLIELKVVDLNCVPKLSPSESTTGASDDKLLELQLYGSDSIFTDASFDMDIGGAMMNKIIGERLSVQMNPSDPNTGKTNLFAKDKEDQVLKSINIQCPIKPTESTDTNTVADADIQQKNIELFLEKAGIYPKVDFTDAGITVAVFSNDLTKTTYIAIYNDKTLFNQYKLGIATSTPFQNTRLQTSNTAASAVMRDANVTGFGVWSDAGYAAATKTSEPSILLPIKFGFTVHGISGIRRGDMFTVNGLPDGYGKENGFFQVTSVKHTVDKMVWKTTVDGGWRRRNINE
jgi:hypothetical protein